MHLKLLFLNGGNVNPFQTTKLFNHYVHDELIYDWNIYHFHLSTNRTKYRYFNDRTKDILFAYVTHDKALFLDIDPHTNANQDVFADEKLIRIINDNWPGVLKESNDVIHISLQLSKSERHRFRKNQINVGVLKVNNKNIVPPGLGITTSGHSEEVAYQLVVFSRWLNRLAKEIAFSQAGKRYKLVFENNRPEVIDLENDRIVAVFDRW